MVFSSTTFVFFFLPVTLIGYFICRNIRVKNIWLLLASLFFYFWGGPTFLPILVFCICFNYFGGILISGARSKGNVIAEKTTFVLVIIGNIANLCYWKYTGFFLNTINEWLHTTIQVPSITLPIGISFFTFQGMSYVIDLYRKRVPVQKNITNIALYISMFPQLIAGPIVRYESIAEQINQRKCTVEEFSSGIRLFVVGLSKKLIIANSVASIADKIFGLPANENMISVSWLGVVCYTFQLYFDFSGYSDMAIGLGRMFGFIFPANFNYPYISRSISEFWRRWHISLSSWFRDYVYIPLGGSRTGNVYLNLLCVFFLTGLWHGASWNFVFWGLIFAVCTITERWIKRHVKPDHFKAMPGIAGILLNVAGWAYTMFVWMMSMVLFRADTLQNAGSYYLSLFGINKLKNVGFTLSYYINRYELFVLIAAAFFSFPVAKNIYSLLKKKLPQIGFTILLNIGTLILFVVNTMYILTETYNPFIYFRF